VRATDLQQVSELLQRRGDVGHVLCRLRQYVLQSALRLQPAPHDGARIQPLRLQLRWGRLLEIYELLRRLSNSSRHFPLERHVREQRNHAELRW
jgi:hypothetical protein